MVPKNTQKWLFLIILMVFLFVLNISLGSINIPVLQIIKILSGGIADNPVWNNIVWDFRMTKALTCILAGAALGASGLQMQTLFRNALAGPDVLGLSSGASLAVSLIFMGGIVTTPNPWIMALAASTGSLIVVLVVLLIATRLKDNVSLLIAGLMIGAGTSSVVSVLQYLSQAEELQSYILWTFGSLGGLSWAEIRVVFVIVVIGAGIALVSVKSLNAWLLGDHYAQSIGIHLQSSRIRIILSTCILTGCVTAFCGPIAFVGLAVPHLVKLLLPTTNHRVLLPAVMAGGASLMLFCDIISQLPGSTQVLPVNAITSLIGAPVVIWVILRNKIVRT